MISWWLTPCMDVQVSNVINMLLRLNISKLYTFVRLLCHIWRWYFSSTYAINHWTGLTTGTTKVVRTRNNFCVGIKRFGFLWLSHVISYLCNSKRLSIHVAHGKMGWLLYSMWLRQSDERRVLCQEWRESNILRILQWNEVTGKISQMLWKTVW